MQQSIVFFNIIFYFITLFFYYQARQDPSTSLGYGLLIMGFWIIMFLILLVGLLTKKIRPVSIGDKIGIFTATPVICLVIMYILWGNQDIKSEYYTSKDGHHYKIVTFSYQNSQATKRIEYYRSADTISLDEPFPDKEQWLEDSVWLCFSEKGDTTGRIHYRNGVIIR
jgi:hypothetical protein